MDLVSLTLFFMAFAVIGGILVMSPEDAFGQMESMTIEGLKYPFVNSVFNLNIDVDGVSRASHGIFRTVITIFEKETGNEILAVPDYLVSGINTIQINMIPDRNTKPFYQDISYVLQIQHVNIISQHEFIPKAYGEVIIVKISDGVSVGESELKTNINQQSILKYNLLS